MSGGAVHFTIVVTKSGSLTGTLAVTLTDTIVPTQALAIWTLPANCTGDQAAGMFTCTWDLPGSLSPVTRTVTVVITTTGVYTGLLINTTEVGAALIDSDPSNNQAQVAVGITDKWSTYLPLVLRNYTPWQSVGVIDFAAKNLILLRFRPKLERRISFCFKYLALIGAPTISPTSC